jgi:hypothetical protein
MTGTEQRTTSVTTGDAQTAPSLNQEVTFQSSPHKISDNLVIERGMVTVRRATLRPTADTATENSGHELNYKIQTPGLPEHTRLAGVTAVEVDKIKQQAPRKPRQGKAQTLNKLEGRLAAESLGVLMQPEFHDLTYILGPDKVIVQISSIDYSNLPLERLFSTDYQLTIINVDLGDARLTFAKESGGVAMRYQQGSEASQEVKVHSLKQLQQTPIFQQTLHSPRSYVTRGLAELRVAQFFEKLSSLDDGIWFLKDVNGSCAHSVVKLELSQGVVTKVDCSSYAEECWSKLVAAGTPNTAPAKLAYLVSSLNPLPTIYWALLERAIPSERIEGRLAEPRLLFYFDGPVKYLCSWSKVAQPGELFPNRSQGGGAEPTRDSVARIVKRHRPEAVVTEDQVNKHRADLITKVSEFATAFGDFSGDCQLHYGPLFAIDVALVWNQELGCIDPWLIEIQSGPGSEDTIGMLPDDEQQHVDEYNKGVDDSYEYFDFPQ